MNNDELEFLRTKLKCGEYDGVDIMKAWIAIEELIALRKWRDSDERVMGFPLETTQMVVCPKCGNKRCPHATDHRHECTRSNEPGQLGSMYGKLQN